MQTASGSRYYVYLISSLPMLHFGVKPPFSFEKFVSMGLGLIPDAELELFERAIDLAGERDFASIRQPTLKRWHEFERALRNELVKIRASRRKLDPSQYLREGNDMDHHLYHVALNAYRNPSPLEGERMLDQERWRFLDELSEGRYFDLDILIIYAMKLLILEKWLRIDSADSRALVEAALKK